MFTNAFNEDATSTWKPEIVPRIFEDKTKREIFWTNLYISSLFHYSQNLESNLDYELLFASLLTELKIRYADFPHYSLFILLYYISHSYLRPFISSKNRPAGESTRMTNYQVGNRWIFSAHYLWATYELWFTNMRKI